MNKQQKYLKKRKERQQKALEARLVIAKKNAKDRQEARKEYLAHKDYKAYLRFEKKREEMNRIIAENIEKYPEETRAKIEKNIEILKALEEEYNQEMATKKKLNEELEAQGHLTLEEKMQALSNKNPEETPAFEEMLENK